MYYLIVWNSVPARYTRDCLFFLDVGFIGFKQRGSSKGIWRGASEVMAKELWHSTTIWRELAGVVSSDTNMFDAVFLFSIDPHLHVPFVSNLNCLSSHLFQFFLPPVYLNPDHLPCIYLHRHYFFFWSSISGYKRYLMFIFFHSH